MGLVYVLTNKINDKQYVGKTIAPFEKRKREHLSASKTNADNMIIHKAIRKYGIESFEIECLKVKGNPDLWEKHLIRRWNTKVPNGYNLTDGGEGTSGWRHTDEAKVVMSKKARQREPNRLGQKMDEEQRLSMLKQYIVTYPDGSEKVITGLQDFCDRNGLSKGNLHGVATGKRNHHKGFKCRFVE